MVLAPQPGRTSRVPRPLKTLSKTVLLQAWNASRDATSRPGRPGIDRVTAQQFQAKLDTNLNDIVSRLQRGEYGFSKLRTVFIPKPDSDKERVICIPTIRDRLVQRAIATRIGSKKLFPINNASSFGFIKGLGPKSAIDRAIDLRGKYDWCLKTDIQSFFDRIPRLYLKERVGQALRGNSLEPLVCRVIDCEVKLTPENRENIRQQGIVAGLGVRQGMPLSPMLANLALAEFDKEVERRRIGMVRYTDDLALFFHTKEEAQEGRHFIRLLLATVNLSIPEIADGSKTKIVPRSDPLEFLGREIIFLGSRNCFVARVGQKQVEKIKAKLAAEFSFEGRSGDGGNLQDTIVDLSRSITAYLGIYRDASNFPQFAQELRDFGQSIITTIFQDIFGRECLSNLTPKARNFLGMETLNILEPDSELDV
jgi:RNA-directed DNA polymerase